MKFQTELDFSPRSDTCPCCGHTARIWRKRINSQAAADLVSLVAKYKGVALHIDTFTTLPKDRNFSQLVLWDLIEPQINTDTKRRASGKWSPTDKGIGFALNELSVQKYVLTRENRIIGTGGGMINIHDALGQKFNYGELLKGYSDDMRRENLRWQGQVKTSHTS